MCKVDRGINLSALCEWKIWRHEILLHFNTALTDLPEEAKEGDLDCGLVWIELGGFEKKMAVTPPTHVNLCVKVTATALATHSFPW